MKKNMKIKFRQKIFGDKLENYILICNKILDKDMLSSIGATVIS